MLVLVLTVVLTLALVLVPVLVLMLMLTLVLTLVLALVPVLVLVLVLRETSADVPCAPGGEAGVGHEHSGHDRATYRSNRSNSCS